ncbi:MAG: peptidase S41 [Alphaproteobacteria bacterium]|nr:peptidase S41 [Alphaproteobacteria bacterium]
MQQVLRSTASRAVLAALCLSLVACGGGGAGTVAVAPSPSPTPPPTATCSLRDRQLWAESQIREWYLFPADLPASLDPAPFTTVQAYIDALTANARAASKDRFFTYITSIAEENAFFSSGQTAAFGIRISYDSVARRAFVIDVFETGPAFAAGFDRSAELLAIGETPASLTSVADLFARGGSAAVSDALGPSNVGVTRTIQFRLGGETRTATITRAEFNIPPVSSRFGTQVLDDFEGGRVGYVNLRSFISTAEAPLRAAFARFRSEGITRVVVDFRYNGGGLVRIAELMGDLMGRNRLASDVFSFTTFRPSKSVENETRQFRSAAESIAPARLAFITTGASASASELVANAMLPYTRGNITLVGANTSGKPVGQIALDRTACDDRLRVVAFATENADRQGDYYTGLAPVFAARGGRTCSASDDFSQPMGSPLEASTQRAIASLNGNNCTAIAGGADGLREQSTPTRALLAASQPNAAQREMPGLF